MKAMFGVILLVFLTANFGICDEPVSLFIGHIEIHGTESQADLLYDLESKYEEEIRQLETTIEEAESRRTTKKSEYESECLKVLNKKQRQEFEAARLEKAVDNLKERLKADKSYQEEMGSILPIIGNATTVELYEGLKRTGMNKFVMPKAGEDTFKVLTYTFYETKLVIDALETTALQDICSNYRSFSGYRGGKFCGGFHPNALIRFIGPDGKTDVLVCFGCSEAIVKTDEKSVILEIEAPAYEKFRHLVLPLLPHHEKYVSEGLMK